MPLNRTPLTGNQIVAMANVSLQRNYTLQGAAVVGQNTFVIVNELNVLGLPSLTYWVRLNSSNPGIVFTPLFSVQNTTVGGTTTVPDWLPFTNGSVLVPGNVFTFIVRSAVANAAVEFTIPGAIPAATVNVDVVITAGG